MFDLSIDRFENGDSIKEVINSYKNNSQSFNPNAFYIALVEDTNDPYKLGRVRIRIPAIHGVDEHQSYYIPNESLPWAKPATLNSAGNDMGQFIIPTKGNRVFVTFEYNAPDKPIYFGGVFTLHNKDKYYNDNNSVFYGDIVTITDDDRIKDLETNSAQTVLFKSFKGSTIIIDDSDGKESIKIIDAAGQQIIMENESDFALERRGETLEPKSTASIKIITAGQLTLQCDDLNIQANTTNIQDYIE